MIVHVHSDGSKGFEYELGDEVIVTKPVGGGWFNHAIGYAGPIVRFDKGTSWRTRFLYVKEKPDWGPAHCPPWGVTPTLDTYARATFIAV